LFSAVADRFNYLKAVAATPWLRWIALLWVALTIYDMLLGQFLPPEWAKNAPRFYDVLRMTGGWLPWWGWLLIGQSIFIIAMIEHGVRADRRRAEAPSSPAHRALRARVRELAVEVSKNSYRVPPAVAASTYVDVIDDLWTEVRRNETLKNLAEPFFDALRPVCGEIIEQDQRAERWAARGYERLTPREQEEEGMSAQRVRDGWQNVRTESEKVLLATDND
jgi:hypothetical protein